MPTSGLKNLLYRAALPFAAPNVRGQTDVRAAGRPVAEQPLRRILAKHHVLGASLLLADGEKRAEVFCSTEKPAHRAEPDTIYRVASITKTATALVTLKCAADGLLSLDTPVADVLPERHPALKGVLVRHLLTHTSGLRDSAAADAALARDLPYTDALNAGGQPASAPGAVFSYCNLGFGLLGCVLEQAAGEDVAGLFGRRLFSPLGMRATLDASTLDPETIMPIERVLPYRAGQAVRVTKLGARGVLAPDPLRHYGHTAGAMYTDAPSLAKLLRVIAQDGADGSRQFLPEALVRDMKRAHAHYGRLSPTLSYGLGLLIIEDDALSGGRILGHQGFAYGCVDGAFYEEKTGRLAVFLNGGCSEARSGRLGLANRDVLRWAFREEMPSWK